MKTSKLLLATLAVALSGQALGGPFLLRQTTTHIYTRQTEYHPWIATERVTGICRLAAACTNSGGPDPLARNISAEHWRSHLSSIPTGQTGLDLLVARPQWLSPEVKAAWESIRTAPTLSEGVAEFTQTPMLVDPKWAQRNLTKPVITEFPILLGPVK